MMDGNLLEQYDFVTAFEVMEHSITPLQSFAELFKYLKPSGLAIISTLCVFDAIGNDLSALRGYYSYFHPRVGHVSIYSIKTLKRIGAHFGLALCSLDIGYHIFYNAPYNNPQDFLKAGAR